MIGIRNEMETKSLENFIYVDRRTRFIPPTLLIEHKYIVHRIQINCYFLFICAIQCERKQVFPLIMRFQDNLCKVEKETKLFQVKKQCNKIVLESNSVNVNIWVILILKNIFI